MATKRTLNDADSEKLWQAMLAAMPAIIHNGAQHPPKGSAQVAREYARSWIAEWRSAVRSGR